MKYVPALFKRPWFWFLFAFVLIVGRYVHQLMLMGEAIFGNMVVDEYRVKPAAGDFEAAVKRIVDFPGNTTIKIKPTKPWLIGATIFICEEHAQGAADYKWMNPKPAVFWKNAHELVISVPRVRRIIYKTEEARGIKITYNIGGTDCPDVNHGPFVSGLLNLLGVISYDPDQPCIESASQPYLYIRPGHEGQTGAGADASTTPGQPLGHPSPSSQGQTQ